MVPDAGLCPHVHPVRLLRRRWWRPPLRPLTWPVSWMPGKGGRQYAHAVRCHDRSCWAPPPWMWTQKMDESRLQARPLAAAESEQCRQTELDAAAAAPCARQGRRGHGGRLQSSQEARLIASEAATAVKLAAKGTAERTAELPVWNSCRGAGRPAARERCAPAPELRALWQGPYARAYPKRHGEKHRSLDELRERPASTSARRHRLLTAAALQMPPDRFLRSGAFFLHCILHKIRRPGCCIDSVFHLYASFALFFPNLFSHIDKKSI